LASRFRCKMFEKTAVKLDGLISRLESNIDASRSLGTRSKLGNRVCATCSYKLTLPFESRCPLCSFQHKLMTKPEMDLISLSEIVKKPASKDIPNNISSEDKTKNLSAIETPSANATRSSQQEFFHADIQISKILSVSLHPEAEKLFVCSISTTEGRSQIPVCAGLVGHYQPEELLGRLVVTVLNLKPRKIRGIESAAMVLAAECNNVVRLLDPAENSKAGDRVFLKDTPQLHVEPHKNLSGNAWSTIVSSLKVTGTVVTYNGIPLSTNNGPIHANLPDSASIH